MRIEQLRRLIRDRRSKGETYESIGTDFGIKKSMVRYIEMHPDYIPRGEMVKTLGLDPTYDAERKKRRRDRLNKLARAWGWPSWSTYETSMLELEEEIA